MPNQFYHVDPRGSLDVGTVMDVGWPPRLEGDLVPRISRERANRLHDLFPEGLSAHGAQHVLPESRAEMRESGGNKYDVLWTLLPVRHPSTGEQATVQFYGVQTQSEHLLELARRFEYDHKPSRFQSYYASESVADAESFRRDVGSHQSMIFKVECEEFDRRDMDCVGGRTFEETLDGCRSYWEGEFTSEDSRAEIVMEPPVEVIELVDDP